jgi:hypothetical protein
MTRITTTSKTLPNGNNDRYHFDSIPARILAGVISALDVAVAEIVALAWADSVGKSAATSG